MSTLQSNPYEIQRNSGRCAATGRELIPGEQYVAALIDDGQTLTRMDFSREAWDRGPRPEHVFGFWMGIVPEVHARPRVFVDDEVLMSLLTRLEDAQQPDRLAFRFVLMLILMRKKLLRYDRTDRRPGPDGHGEQEWWILTPKLDLTKGPLGKWADHTLSVLDPRLNDDQIRAVTEQLGQILNAEL